MAIEYHERMRKKLQEKGYSRQEFEREAIKEYLKILDGIIQILQTKREQLRKMLEEGEGVTGTGS
ncbi:hypothetical protein D1872_341240 [compost metagenome]